MTEIQKIKTWQKDSQNFQKKNFKTIIYINANTINE